MRDFLEVVVVSEMEVFYKEDWTKVIKVMQHHHHEGQILCENLSLKMHAILH